MLTLLPMSVSLAAIDCMFHEESSEVMHESMHDDDTKMINHDTLMLDIGDIELVSMDDGMSPDNGCSMKLMSAAAASVDIDGTNIWSHSYAPIDGDYSLTAVLLPTEIRPPIV